MVENSGKHIAGFAAVFVFNSARKRLVGGLCVVKKSESICINSLFYAIYRSYTFSIILPFFVVLFSCDCAFSLTRKFKVCSILG